MGNLLAIIGELFFIGSAIYVILLFGGIYRPSFKSPDIEAQFDKTINRYGKWLVFGGAFLFFMSCINIVKILW